MRAGSSQTTDDVFTDFSDRVTELFSAHKPGDRGDQPDSSASTVGRTLLFLIDSATDQLERLRAIVAADADASAEGSVADAEPRHHPDDKPDPVFGGRSVGATIRLLLDHIVQMPESAARHYARFAGEALRILEGESVAGSVEGDFRFKDRLWNESPFFRGVLELYRSFGRALEAWLDEQPLTVGDKRRIAFLFEQLMAAVAPSNLPLNPSALRRANTTEGASVVDGAKHFVDDILHNKAMPRQISPRAYTIGKDLAVSPGAVVFRNEHLELIQYAANTQAVRRRPVLLIPPQINKFYCFDLRPQNSLVGHLVDAGVQMFVLSWRNPGSDQAGWSLETYVAATIEAMDAIAAITRSRSVGLISACAGGLTAMAVMGYLAMCGDRRVRHHSLLVTCLSPNNGSKLELFATRDLIELTRRHVRINGTMDGDGLAKLFAWLRPTDLVWRYWINNYLLGKTPPPLDVLFWDNDPTRLPAELHSDFCAMFEEDVFRNPHALTLLGKSIDFRKIQADFYLVGGEDDYLMPWRSCFEASRVHPGRHTFVLSNSGHVQSILRPPRLASSHYYTNPKIELAPDLWLQSAVKNNGSWWPHWWAWVNDHSGGLKRPPRSLGCADYRPLERAPGTYVFAR